MKLSALWQEFLINTVSFSLIKMVFCFARQRGGWPALEDIEHAVRRNFSGLDELDAWEIFSERLEVCCYGCW